MLAFNPITYKCMVRFSPNRSAFFDLKQRERKDTLIEAHNLSVSA